MACGLELDKSNVRESEKEGMEKRKTAQRKRELSFSKDGWFNVFGRSLFVFVVPLHPPSTTRTSPL